MSRTISYPSTGNTATVVVDEASFWYLHRNKLVAYLAEKYISKNKQFYDIGGGNGIVSSMLQQKEYACTLIEPYSDGVDNARRRGIGTVVESTLQDYEQSLGNAGLFDVLEHIEKPIEFLKKLHDKQLATDKVIITVPAFNSLYTQVDTVCGHYKRYAYTDLKAELESVGYKVITWSYFFMPLVVPLFLFRVLPYKLGIKTDMANRVKKVHKSNNTILGKLALCVLSLELKLINLNLRLPLGTSLVVVAEKK